MFFPERRKPKFRVAGERQPWNRLARHLLDSQIAPKPSATPGGVLGAAAFQSTIGASKMSENPRHRTRPIEKDDPNLGQKEAEREKAELEEKQDKEEEDELEPMERLNEQGQRPGNPRR